MKKSLNFWKYLLWNKVLLHNKTIICLFTLYFYLLTIINFWNQECLQNFKEFVLAWLNSICFFKFFQSTEFSVNLQSYFYKVYCVERLIKSRSLSIICHDFIFKWWQYEIIWLKNYIYSSQNNSSMEEVSIKVTNKEI